MNDFDRETVKVGSVFGVVCILVVVGLLKACDAGTGPGCTPRAEHGFFRGCLR